HLFCILIPTSASTPFILGKSRMRKRACTDLCGGRSVMVVPTATVIALGRVRRSSADPQNTMISGQPAEATYRVDRAPQESAKVQQGYRESQRSFWRKWPAASEIQTGHTRALTNFPNQLRWS